MKMAVADASDLTWEELKAWQKLSRSTKYMHMKVIMRQNLTET